MVCQIRSVPSERNSKEPGTLTPLLTKPFGLFVIKVSYGTLCTKPFSPFIKKKFHTKPSFCETTKGSERVPVARSLLGFLKYLFVYSKSEYTLESVSMSVRPFTR